MSDNNEASRELVAKALFREYSGLGWQKAQREAERLIPWGSRQ